MITLNATVSTSCGVDEVEHFILVLVLVEIGVNDIHQTDGIDNTARWH